MLMSNTDVQSHVSGGDGRQKTQLPGNTLLGILS